MRPIFCALVALVVNSAACSKKSDAPASPPAEPTVKPETPPATPPPAGSAAAGSAAAGSAAAAPVEPAPAAPDPAAKPPAAAEPADPRESELCPKVLEKIVECQKDKAFIAALDEGVSAKQKQINKQLRKEITEWPDTSCNNLAAAFEHGGFIYHWKVVASAPDALESCAKLGAVINKAGGLFGGDQAN